MRVVARSLCRYEKQASLTYTAERRFYALTSLAMAVPNLFTFSVVALVRTYVDVDTCCVSWHKAFGYGGKLVRDGDIDGGRVIRVLFAVIMGAMGLGQVDLSCVCVCLWIHISLR